MRRLMAGVSATRTNGPTSREEGVFRVRRPVARTGASETDESPATLSGCGVRHFVEGAAMGRPRLVGRRAAMVTGGEAGLPYPESRDGPVGRSLLPPQHGGVTGPGPRTVGAFFAGETLFVHDGLRTWTIWSNTCESWLGELAVVLRLVGTDVHGLGFADPVDEKRFWALIDPARGVGGDSHLHLGHAPSRSEAPSAPAVSRPRAGQQDLYT